jgi:hypothetical protein
VVGNDVPELTMTVDPTIALFELGRAPGQFRNVSTALRHLFN